MREFKFNSIALAALGLAITLQHPSAMAFTRNLGAAAPNCDHANSEHTDFRNLIHKAHIMGNPDGTLDDRRVTMSRAHTVGVQLSREERLQMLACHGTVECVETVRERGGRTRRMTHFASGSVSIDSGTLRTAAHTLYDQGRLAPSRMNCTFKDYSGVSQQLSLPSADRLAAINPSQNPRDDRLAVRLERPLSACNPYPVISYPLQPGEDIIAVTGVQDRMRTDSGASDREPVITPGVVGHVFPPRGGGPSLMKLNLSATEGASGGRILVRRNGVLYDAGMIITSPSQKYDGRQFDMVENMVTGGLALDAGFLEMVQNPHRSPTPTAGTNQPSIGGQPSSGTGAPVQRSRSSQTETTYTDI